jgi:hypothetical protein
MGALAALNRMLLLEPITAFLFSMIQKIHQKLAGKAKGD